MLPLASQSFDLIFDYLLVNLPNVQTWFAISFRMVCRSSILPEIRKPCFFFMLFNFRRLLAAPYPQTISSQHNGQRKC